MGTNDEEWQEATFGYSFIHSFIHSFIYIFFYFAILIVLEYEFLIKKTLIWPYCPFQPLKAKIYSLNIPVVLKYMF